MIDDRRRSNNFFINNINKSALLHHLVSYGKVQVISSTLSASLSMSNKSPRVTFSSITPNNIGTVRKLNSVLFPIRYGDKFYKDILLPEVEDFCKLGV